MEIFMPSVPHSITEKQLSGVLRRPLGAFGIRVYHVNVVKKPTLKAFAFLTVLDATQGQVFINRQEPLYFQGTYIRCQRSNKIPTQISLRNLAKELQILHRREHQHPAEAPQRGAKKIATNTISLSCGTRDYVQNNLVFVQHYQDLRRGKITFDTQQVVISIPAVGPSSAGRIVFSYYDIDHAVKQSVRVPNITITLRYAPKCYQIADTEGGVALVTEMLASMGFAHGIPSRGRGGKAQRTCGINSEHHKVSGTCFVYQIKLSDLAMATNVYSKLTTQHKIRGAEMPHSVKVYDPGIPLSNSFEQLQSALARDSPGLPFTIKFQLLRLALNGAMSPERVLNPVTGVSGLLRDRGHDATAMAIFRLCTELEPAGPFTDAESYNTKAFLHLVTGYAEAYTRSSTERLYHVANRHSHIRMIHKLIVTPSGMYLEGPSPEVTNRVLRKYDQYSDNFVRVSFVDEDGDNIKHDPEASMEEIYHRRFRSFLDSTYILAGKGFVFLGFSHSSLRSQSCWFMSSFVASNAELMHAPLAIQRLGDFSGIRSPAKCAAWIGQAFTDTTGTVKVPTGAVNMVSEVERNGRTFSDGCGTISPDLAKDIGKVYGTRRALKPTVFQIRYGGAKGVVSIDNTLSGKQLSLRKSMVKFPSVDTTLGICGAAFGPLPMVLNHQFIQIFEDPGVPILSFLSLQSEAINKLRGAMTNAKEAAQFLDEGSTSKTAQFAQLLRSLNTLGLEVLQDPFLRKVLEMGMISKLRDMKYRGRIPVERGTTLYGIMDETGFLQEGEVYVTTEQSPLYGRKVLVRDKVVITRSPALHPGDIRVVKAVQVPDKSLLANLSNCVVFS